MEEECNNFSIADETLLTPNKLQKCGTFFE